MKFEDTRPAGARVFETRLRIPFSDIDSAGILYFAAYWRYVERAEMDMFRDLGFPYERFFDDLNVWLPRVRTVAEYHAPSLIDDWLLMRSHIEKVGVSSVRWKTVVYNERTGEAGAAFTLTCAGMHRTTRRSCPLPETLRAALVAAWTPPPE